MMKKNILLICILAVLMFLCSCDSGDDEVKTAADFTAEGWIEFEAGNYAAALEKFDEALAISSIWGEAYTGSAWANGRLNNFDEAIDAGEEAFAYLGDDLRRDAIVAVGFAHWEKGSDSHIHIATGFISTILAEAPNYVFVHDTSITALDLQLTLAQCYWAVDMLEQAQSIIDELDPANGLDPNDPNTWEWNDSDYPTYKEALLKKLEELQEILNG